MNNYITLTKTFFLASFRVNKKKKNVSKDIKSYLYMGLLFLALSFFYNYSFYSSIKESGAGEYNNLLIYTFSLATLLTLILSVNQMQGNIFNTKDYEFLSSLPVSNRCIIASRISSVLIMTLFEDLLILLPSTIIYYIFTSNLVVAIFSLLASLFASFIPILLSSILGSLVAIITKKVKNKSLVSIIFNLILVLTATTISFLLNNQTYVDVSLQLKVIPYLGILYKSFVEVNFLYLLLFIVINILAFVISVILISLLYKKINSMNDVANKVSTYVSTDIKDTSISKTLFKKEIKMLFSSGLLFVNMFLGPILEVLISIVMIVVSKNGEAPSENFSNLQLMVAIIGSIGIMMNMMTASTAATFSLENKNFELLLSYPIKVKEIIKAKIKADLFVNAIMNVIASAIIIILLIAFKYYDIGIYLQVLILPHLAYISASLIGTLCGMKWAKLDYSNEMEVIKSGSNIGFTMLFSALPGFIIYGINSLINILSLEGYCSTILAAIISPIAFILTILILISILKRKGEKLFYRINK